MRLIGRVCLRSEWLWLVLLSASTVCGQTLSRTTLRMPAQGQLTDGVPPYSAPAADNEGVLLDMAARASVIFVGTVTSVHRPSDDLLRGGSGAAVVEVVFHVERSVRGAGAGAIYALREWAGMWRDAPRFLPGQRLLMLLHAPGPGGLSSPVDGLDGAIPIRSGGLLPAMVLSAKDCQAGAATSSGDEVDMRWLQAKTVKSLSYADAPTASPGVTPVNTVAGPITASSTGEASQSGKSETAVSELLSRILGLLGSVQALNRDTLRASN